MNIFSLQALVLCLQTNTIISNKERFTIFTFLRMSSISLVLNHPSLQVKWCLFINKGFCSHTSLKKEKYVLQRYSCSSLPKPPAAELTDHVYNRELALDTCSFTDTKDGQVTFSIRIRVRFFIRRAEKFYNLLKCKPVIYYAQTQHKYL